MLIESDRRRAQWIEEQLGSVVLNAPADEGRFQMEAGCQRADKHRRNKCSSGNEIYAGRARRRQVAAVINQLNVSHVSSPYVAQLMCANCQFAKDPC